MTAGEEKLPIEYPFARARAIYFRRLATLGEIVLVNVPIFLALVLFSDSRLALYILQFALFTVNGLLVVDVVRREKLMARFRQMSDESSEISSLATAIARRGRTVADEGIERLESNLAAKAGGEEIDERQMVLTQQSVRIVGRLMKSLVASLEAGAYAIRSDTIALEAWTLEVEPAMGRISWKSIMGAPAYSSVIERSMIRALEAPTYRESVSTARMAWASALESMDGSQRAFVQHFIRLGRDALSLAELGRTDVDHGKSSQTLQEAMAAAEAARSRARAAHEAVKHRADWFGTPMRFSASSASVWGASILSWERGIDLILLEGHDHHIFEVAVDAMTASIEAMRASHELWELALLADASEWKPYASGQSFGAIFESLDGGLRQAFETVSASTDRLAALQR